MGKVFKLILVFLFSANLFAQNLLDERIRRIAPRKRSIFLERGIFHNGGPKRSSSLKAIRHNFSKSAGYERLVFDFGTKEIPRVYGYISGNEKRLYIDLFDTKLVGQLGSFGNSKYVESINFFPIQSDTLSVEVIFKKKITVDIFYLLSPGRFVVDIKG
ncbi:MAG: hypothetical protein GY909_12325 [Oligoflexia bacterium]|nr:hypothetical protein [Oligoflexia bacterium]